MSLSALKLFHLALVATSLGGFLVRGGWMLTDSPRLNHRMTRILPHVADTLLLLSGAALIWVTHQYPLQQPWLTAKLSALPVYIALGAIALRHGSSRGLRVGSLVGALTTIGYIIAVALTHDPWPFA